MGGASITPDDDVFVHLAKVYSYNHGSMHQGNGCADTGLFLDGITNGYQWYPLAGQHDAVKQTIPYDSFFSFCSSVENESLPQVKEYQFTIEGKMEQEIDRQICAASAVM